MKTDGNRLRAGSCVKNAQQVQQGRELAAAKKSAQANLKRTDGYDSSQLIAPLRPLFREFIDQKLQQTNYFETTDTAAVESALDDIEQWYVKHTAHTQDESVVGLHDQLFDLASDPGETNNLFEQRTHAAGLLQQRLLDLEKTQAASAAPSSRAEVREELKEQLKALGYVDGG